jgi:putative NADH-flavin reductase
MNPNQAVLIIGASGRTGSHLIQQLSSKHWHSRPQIYGFCRDPAKLDQSIKGLCHDVVQGNARSSTDIERALQESAADLIVVSIGNGDSVKKSDIRTESAKALVQVLGKPEYQHVHVLVVSSIGAGESRIKAGFGIGKLIEFHLRHVLKDHSGQEEAFLSSPMKDRTMIVRPIRGGDIPRCSSEVALPWNIIPSPGILCQPLGIWSGIAFDKCPSNFYRQLPVSILCA